MQTAYHVSKKAMLLLLLLLLLQVRESDIGTRAGLFEVVKIGDEFFTFIVDCKVRGGVG
jgi:hypothetical protein